MFQGLFSTLRGKIHLLYIQMCRIKQYKQKAIFGSVYCKSNTLDYHADIACLRSWSPG